jgi:hypothetical protein
MKKSVLIFLFSSAVVFAGDDERRFSGEDIIDEGYLSLETGIGFNTYSTSKYARMPLIFNGGSRRREISTRIMVLSDIIHASDYFSGTTSFMKQGGLYAYNFGLLDIDYLSWHGKIWSAGFGGGLGHQGYLIEGADKTAHAIVGRLRGQAFFYWFDYFASQVVVTLPIAFYQSSTNEFKSWQGELNLLFDFKGKVRNPEPDSLMFAVSLHYEYIHLSHEIRTYSQHEITPNFKVMFIY